MFRLNVFTIGTFGHCTLLHFGFAHVHSLLAHGCTKLSQFIMHNYLKGVNKKTATGRGGAYFYVSNEDRGLPFYESSYLSFLP